LLASALWRHVPAVPSGTVLEVGSVELFDLAAQQQNALISFSPPPDPGASNPGSNQHFGFEIKGGRIDADSIDDIVVGAPEADGTSGRVYVFFGHASFRTNPIQQWIGIKPPAGRGSFGASVLIEDFDRDGLQDLMVGAYQRFGGDGAVYIYKNSTINAIAAGTVATPVPDQVILNPQAAVDDAAWFGFRLFEIGDVGSTTGVLDGIPDIAIHAEGTDFIDPLNPSANIPDVGGLFVYFGYSPGETPIPSQPMIPDVPVLLLAPGNFGGPQTNERFGRAAVGLDWVDGLGNVARWLAVSGPDKTVPDPVTGAPIEHAGHVVLFRTPLFVNAYNGSAWPLNLTDATPEPFEIFGGWMAACRYRTDKPGQQLIVSARGKTVGTALGAGTVFTYFGEAGP
jgi:FG-GAP repeat